MPYVDHARREIRLKIVYCGPGLGGKTTNIEYIHRHTRREHRGKLISLNGESERTLFFDLLPMNIGSYRDYTLRAHLCSVPGQIAQEHVRQLVLRNVDGVVFVVDSQPARVADNEQSLLDLEENIRLLGLDFARLPMVVQLNKRDLAGSLGVARTRAALSLPPEVMQFIASAARGEGVFETLKAILKECLATVDIATAASGYTPALVRSRAASRYASDEATSEVRAKLCSQLLASPNERSSEVPRAGGS